MFVLFAIAVTTLAIATYYIYENYVEPIIRELVLPTLYDDEAEPEAEGTDQGAAAAGIITAPPAAPAQPNAAAPAANAQTAGDGGAPPPADDGGGTTPPAPVAPEDDPAKRAIYNDLLAAYHDAEAQGWQGAVGSEYQDLSSLGAVMVTHTDVNVSVPYDRVESGTVSYAYVDLGGDGTLDLAIPAVQDDGSYDLLGLFNTDGAEPISITNGDVGRRSYWKVRDDLTLENGGPYSAWEYNNVVYRVQGGDLVVVMRYGYDENGHWKEDAEGTRTSITPEEYEGLKASGTATLEWHPLSEFVEVKPDAATEDATTPDGTTPQG